MPKKDIDYSRTIIYKIVCQDNSITDLYVGSTTDFTKRKCCHKNKCQNENKRDYNLKLYQFIRDNGGWSNWEMVPVEEFPCENGFQARIRERFWFEELKASLNSRFPSRSQTEYQIDTKEKIKEYHCEYNLKNKEKRKEYLAKYNEKNKEIVLEKQRNYYLENKEIFLEKQREYNLKNKEKTKEYQAEYRLKNKEKTKEYQAEYRLKMKK